MSWDENLPRTSKIDGEVVIIILLLGEYEGEEEEKKKKEPVYSTEK